MKTGKNNRSFIITLTGIICTLFLSCEKKEEFPKVYGTVTDRDGIIYNTVSIGLQVWMTENLRTTHFNDGTPILYLAEDSSWSSNTQLTYYGYCWYDNDSSNRGKYGALYKITLATSGLLCPDGWHIPTNSEWDDLTTYLGGDLVAGGKLKDSSTIYWKSPNVGATDESSFTALPGGYRDGDGTFSGIGDSGFWFSSSIYHSSSVMQESHNSLLRWGYRLGFDNDEFIVDTYNTINSPGFSVRCIKDRN